MTIPTFPSTSLPGITFPVERHPFWMTDQEESVAGLTARYAFRTQPKYHYELPFSFLRMSTTFGEWQTLVNFFNSLFGSQGVFQYKDVNDYQCSSGSLGTGDGVTSSGFQLTRIGPGPLGTFVEAVYAPTTITSLRVATSTYTSTQYTISTGGKINFSSGAPANGAALKWDGEFNWLCEFDSDVLELSQIVSNLYELQKLPFTTKLLG